MQAITDQAMKLTDYLKPDSIHLQLKASTKDQVLAELVDLLAASGRITHKEGMLEALREREGLGSTGIGHGVAIPHVRSAELKEPFILLGRTRHDVDFDSIDSQPTRLYFLLVAPENGGNEHLHLLSRIARLMRDPATRQSLLEGDSAEQVAEVIRKQDA